MVSCHGRKPTIISVWLPNKFPSCLPHPQPLSISNELDGAILICSINIVLAQPVNQSLQNLRAGMAKWVVSTH